MRETQSLSLKQARRLVLAAQGFNSRQPKSVKAIHLNAAIERLGVVQIDSVNALVRSHYLPLFSRLGNYSHALLEQAAWSSGRQRKLFEYWGHEASLLPMSVYPLLRWRMRRAEQGEGIYRQLAKFGREQQPLIRSVLQSVKERGALGAGSLAAGDKSKGPWWGWSDEKHALEWLFAAGHVTVAGRNGFERLYDLPERVLPAEALNHADIDEATAQRQLLMHSAQALGVASEVDLRDYFRLDARDSKVRINELLESGELTEIAVQGWDKPGYHPTASLKIPRKVTASALLSPFDSLVWQRQRTERLFDFRYRLEIYTPQHKRVYGYYVLPFLHNEQLLARLDLRAERAKGCLALHALHSEAGGLDDSAIAAMAEQLQRMAAWLGLASVAVNCRRPEAARLQAQLQVIGG
ncbi:winged helix-turn-helix domain-containing protein [Pseudomonas sp. M30-35]|uniref:winged helix-turn-helix domain-containing protein n=1 Tax=Pseudomonas sp. M30-35 TaxID=1981174 RepID=UPI000B3C7DBD|nr:winged helix-turn-helix domain-containing protein [Pseudomonas sp. M30-35]ARU88986.1 cytoplasmic protein [Pseudomonas sp. M30-35]